MSVSESTSTTVITIGAYITKAKEYVRAAAILFGDPKLFSPAGSNLHTGTELYLKAYLHAHGHLESELRGHRLWPLLEKSKRDGLNVTESSQEGVLWLRQFGDLDGGIRYLRRSGGGYAIPLDIFERLQPLFETIDSGVDSTLDITSQHTEPKEKP